MFRTPKAVAIILLAWPGVAWSSGPIGWKFDGCVIDGMLVDTDGHLIQPGSKEDRDRLRRYEGDRISFATRLNPGDFIDEPGDVEVSGRCDLLDEPAFKAGLASAYWSRARSVARGGVYYQALVWLSKATDLENSCFYLVTRAKLYLLLGHKTAALKVIQEAARERCKADAARLAKTAEEFSGEDPNQHFCSGDATCSEFLGLFVSYDF